MNQDGMTKQCPYCGEEISVNAKKCKHCREWLEEKPIIQHFAQSEAQPKVIITQVERRSNGVGTAGFVIALIGLCFSWAPILNFIIWFIGMLLSFVGMFRRPCGLAIAGFLISIIDFILIVAVFGTILGVLSSS